MTGIEPERTHEGPYRAPLIARHSEQCVGCWGCVRHCPAKALRVVDGVSEVIEERCVACGQCVTECGHAGHIVRDDLPAVRSLLSDGRPVVALLASEYVAALHPRDPAGVEVELRAAGFSAVETTVLGEELVAAAYEQAHTRGDRLLPKLRSTCPVAVDWVRHFYPQLTDALVSIVPPYVAQARLVRSMYPGDVAVVYVSPCWARKEEALDERFAGAVDVAIGFDELAALIDGGCAADDASSVPAPPAPVKQLSVTDGFPRATLSERDLTDREIATVRGLDEIDRLLAALVRGETAPAVIDMLNCEGCIDGPCVGAELSVYAKRNIVVSERDRRPPPAIDSRTLLSALPAVELGRVFEPAPAPTREPSDAEIDAVLAAGEFASRADAIDCGACGYATCVEHAAAICLGNSTWELCFPLQVKVLERERERYREAATIDELTGLMNRRAFDERLAEEVARARRYDTPLSLVMVDLDDFKLVNDRHGHAAGDLMLRTVGVLLRSELRGTDVAVRYGGDEFALVLPGTAKTDAWAVAEKIRDSLKRLCVDGAAVPLAARASFGVAAFGPDTGDAKTLLQAADSALYRAKNNGRDRVEIAAG